MPESANIMDDKVVTQVKYTSDGRINEWEVSIDPVKVAEAVKNFNVILRSAKRVELFEAV
jgi:hypothetical protein